MQKHIGLGFYSRTRAASPLMWVVSAKQPYPWVFDGRCQQSLCQSGGVETPQESGKEEDENSWGVNRV
jgi:hypothetical protein